MLLSLWLRCYFDLGGALFGGLHIVLDCLLDSCSLVGLLVWVTLICVCCERLVGLVDCGCGLLIMLSSCLWLRIFGSGCWWVLLICGSLGWFLGWFCGCCLVLIC